MKLKRFVLFFISTLVINVGLVIFIGAQRTGANAMFETLFDRPILLAPFVAVSLVVGLSSIKKAKR